MLFIFFPTLTEFRGTLMEFRGTLTEFRGIPLNFADCKSQSLQYVGI